MKKIIFLLIILICLSGCGINKRSDKLTIISTSFPGYDFARAIVDDKADLKMLLYPGAETHDYEPTPQDIVSITNSDIFIYVGGESDSWIDKIISNIDLKKTRIIKLMDLVDLYKEDIVDGMEGVFEDEYDEHVWTSPKNAITIVERLKEEIIRIDNDNYMVYEDNANKYIKELEDIDTEIREVVNNSKRKELIFGDRFPLRYFVEEYGLTYYAAFPGCSEQNEASAKTIAFLIKKINEDNIPVVLHIELSNNGIAQTISDETGAKILEFNTVHNITPNDFNNGVTYVDIMKNNIEVLKECLN